jgi:hypothetical protein
MSSVEDRNGGEVEKSTKKADFSTRLRLARNDTPKCLKFELLYTHRQMTGRRQAVIKSEGYKK